MRSVLSSGPNRRSSQTLILTAAVAALAGLGLFAPSAQAAVFTWNRTGTPKRGWDGSGTSVWTGGVAPTANGSNAGSDVIINTAIAANQEIDIEQTAAASPLSYIIGTLTIGASTSAGRYNLSLVNTAGGSSLLIFDNTGNAVTPTVSSATQLSTSLGDTISVNIALKTDLNITNNSSHNAAGNVLQDAFVWSGTLQANTAGAKTITYNAAANQYIVQSGSISNGSGSLAVKISSTGSGLVYFSGNDTYTGNTTIQTGTLKLVAASNNIASSAKIIVGDTSANNAAKFDITGVSGGFTLASTQTLAGHGHVVGNVAVGSGVLAPGNSVGTLTFDSTSGNTLALSSSSTSSFEITDNASANTYDKVVGGGGASILTYGGTLNVSILTTTPNAIGTYTLFSGFGSHTGAFSAISLPAVSGFQWHDFGSGVLFNYATGQIQLEATATNNSVLSLAPTSASLNILKGGSLSASTTLTNTQSAGPSTAYTVTPSGAGLSAPGGGTVNAGATPTLTASQTGTAYTSIGASSYTISNAGNVSDTSGSKTFTVNYVSGNATAATPAGTHDHSTLGTALSAAVSSIPVGGLASKVVTGGSFVDSFETEAIITDGSLGGDRTLSMAWRQRAADESTAPASPPLQQANGPLLSDVVSLSGLSGSDYVLLEVSYDPALLAGGEAAAILAGQIRLMWLNPHTGGLEDSAATSTDDQWQFATAGQPGGSTFLYEGDVTPSLSYGLGAFGVDTSGSTHYAWAIVSRNGQFAVVPEPASLALFALGAGALLTRRRNHRPPSAD